MPRSLVTGGAGFIGSNLVDALVGLGHDVVCLDNESSKSNDRFHWNSRADNHKVDICDQPKIERLFAGVDLVFHLAASARIATTIDDPIGTFRTNVLGTVVVLECARKNGARRLVYSSTSSAYGRNEPPHKESQQDDPLNPYSVSKVSGEKACRMYSDLFGLDTVSLRYFNVYGPREPTKGKYAPVMGIFRSQKDRGEPLTIAGDGLQRRDFTHVYDVVRANLLASEAEIPKEKRGRLFNIGSGVNFSVLEIANMVSGEKVFLPPRPGEMKETLADNSRAASELGWRPTFNFEDYALSFSS
jgi:UDP-glucose 4-epimerase